MGRRRRCAALAGTVAWAAVACSGPSGGPDAVPAPTTAPAHVSGLFAVVSTTLGPIVIDGQGFVLYRSDLDSAHPSRSACVGACLARWIPVVAAGDLRMVGIDRQLVGRLDRPDGTTQVTLAGWPLYGYAGDRMPGDINGAGYEHSWYAITPDGAKAG